jgi:hypothetical protein
METKVESRSESAKDSNFPGAFGADYAAEDGDHEWHGTHVTPKAGGLQKSLLYGALWLGKASVASFRTAAGWPVAPDWGTDSRYGFASTFNQHQYDGRQQGRGPQEERVRQLQDTERHEEMVVPNAFHCSQRMFEHSSGKVDGGPKNRLAIKYVLDEMVGCQRGVFIIWGCEETGIRPPSDGGMHGVEIGGGDGGVGSDGQLGEGAVDEVKPDVVAVQILGYSDSQYAHVFGLT